jgi:hypothetical protein
MKIAIVLFLLNLDSRNTLLYFPNLVPALVIRFKSVDDQKYFIESLHTYAHCIWISDELPSDIIQFIQMIENETPLLYVFNLVSVKHISGVKRGARVKSLAMASRHPWIHVFKV